METLTILYIIIFLLFHIKQSKTSEQLEFQFNKTVKEIPASLTISNITSMTSCCIQCRQRHPLCQRVGFNESSKLCHLKMLNSNNDVMMSVDEVFEVPFFSKILPKLMVFYNFQSSFENIFGSEIYPLTPFNIERNSSGANFPGLVSAYLQTNSSGALRDHFFTNKEFSIYARMIRTRRATSLDYVNLIVKFTPCDGGDNGGVYFYEDFNNDKMKIEVGYYTSTHFKRYQLGVTHSPIGVKTEYSIGASLNAAGTSAEFYQNEVITSGNVQTPIPGVRGETKFKCMDIGRWGNADPSENNHCLSSQLLCLGVANTVLTLEDYQLLDKLCKP